MKYRRSKTQGGSYFFTVVTHQRQKILCYPDNIQLLRQSFRYVLNRHPFTIDAVVILPDHIHCLWTLPANDCDYSTRWRLIKSYFSRHCNHKFQGNINPSKQSKKERGFWQRRFWEHQIRNQEDWIHHVDYIHYNPVGHGLVKAPKDWQYSSFHRYVQNQYYDVTWGANEDIIFTDDIGGE